MKCRYVAMVAALAATADVVLVHTVTPMSVGPLGILAFFVCLYIATASICYLVMAAVKRIAMRVVQHNMYRGLASVTPLKLYYYASIIGLIPVILLGMQSIGGVTAWDVLLLVLFLSLGCFYVHKRF
ncbi:hypothetical protein [Candidatus Nanosynbacter lyticus]|uniref:hypothetical protein n=1 Tax=Candidatus Nanosynbacter lyticus TaxID=2093824 RepID=UPI0025576482|nr:hypothetical protein [Candidatus Nanosynbacter lyticus]